MAIRSFFREGCVKDNLAAITLFFMQWLRDDDLVSSKSFFRNGSKRTI